MAKAIHRGTRKHSFAARCDAVGWRAPLLERCEPVAAKVSEPLPLPDGDTARDRRELVLLIFGVVCIGTAIVGGVLLFATGW